jgi:hypothetical protein
LQSANLSTEICIPSGTNRWSINVLQVDNRERG